MLQLQFGRKMSYQISCREKNANLEGKSATIAIALVKKVLR